MANAIPVKDIKFDDRPNVFNKIKLMAIVRGI
jgi:hypothetical protein